MNCLHIAKKYIFFKTQNGGLAAGAPGKEKKSHLEILNLEALELLSYK